MTYRVGLYTLTSPLHDEAAVNATSAAFVSEIEKAAGLSFDFRGSDFSKKFFLRWMARSES